MHSEKKVLKETTPYIFTEQKGFQKPKNCRFIRISEHEFNHAHPYTLPLLAELVFYLIHIFMSKSTQLTQLSILTEGKLSTKCISQFPKGYIFLPL